MTWSLHKQPPDLVAYHSHSIFENGEKIIILLDAMPGKEPELQRLVDAVNNIDRITAERDVFMTSNAALTSEWLKMRMVLEWVVARRWDENADLDTICTHAENALASLALPDADGAGR